MRPRCLSILGLACLVLVAGCGRDGDAHPDMHPASDHAVRGSFFLDHLRPASLDTRSQASVIYSPIDERGGPAMPDT